MEQEQPTLRVCVLGAESTGKTTLCADLAARLDAPFVPEFGRWYTEAMPDPRRYTWTHDDFVTIARTQNRFEDDAARWVHPVLVCDTNAFTTMVFEEEYLGAASPEVCALAEARRYDAFVLCDPHTPFADDRTTGLRRRQARERMHARYEEHARASGVPVIQAEGSREVRVATVLELAASLVPSHPLIESLRRP